MVIVNLIGGLGNQLFQYAAGRSLSIAHQTNLKLDISGFEEYKLRTYGLDPFCVQEVFASPVEIANVTGSSKKGLSRFVFRARERLKPHFRRVVFSEPHFRPFNPDIFKTPTNVYLNGYWQSEKYFADIKDIIRREFTLKYEPDSYNREMIKRISSANSVSIHIRRGDYVSNPVTNRIHGTCTLDYYERCVSLISRKIDKPEFFVFSDDPDWAADNLRLDYPAVIVTHNGVIKAHEDLRLMSSCKHNILANSSFSWWAAWLNPNPDKMVYVPQQWFKRVDVHTRDLILNDWIKV